MLSTALSSTLFAASFLAASPQEATTAQHDNTVRAAQPGNEGPLRFAPLSDHHATSQGLTSNASWANGNAVVYDVATGVETGHTLPPSQDMWRWIEGSVDDMPGHDEPISELWSSDLGPITPSAFPWTAHVRVFGTNNGVAFEASGTLISPSILITAGHVVHGGPGGTWSSGVSVAPAWDGDSDAFGTASATNFGAFNGWVNSGNQADNLAFISLNRPVGFVTGTFGYGYDTDDSFYTSNFFNTAGYPDANSCYSGAPDQQYYGFGNWDAVSGGILTSNASWSCDAKGVDGAGMYAIIGGSRFVHGVHTDHDVPNQSIQATRLTSTHTNFYEGSMVPAAYPSSIPDYVPLAVSGDMGGATIFAGDALVSMDYVLGNASTVDPTGTQTYVAEVYLSTNNNISEFDTLIQTHYFDHDFGALDSVVVNVAVPPTIPEDTPSGTYWIGVITKSFDGDSTNNDTDGADAFQIEVDGCNIAFTPFGEGLPGSGGFAPFLYGTGSSCEAGGHTINIVGALGGTSGDLWVGFATWDLFPFYGGHFYVNFTQPYFRFSIPISGPNGVPGVGTLTLPGGDVRSAGPVTIYLQASLRDAGAPQGVSLTNALTLQINN